MCRPGPISTASRCASSIRGSARNVNLSSQFIIDRQRDRQRLLPSDLPIFEDRMTVLRAATTPSYNHPDGNPVRNWALSCRGASTRFMRAFGPTRQRGNALSRQGADVVFLLTGSFSYQRAIRERFALGLTGRFQTSFGDPLLTSEQFSIAGPGELSTFDTGALRGDSGWVVQAEFSNPAQRSGAGNADAEPLSFVGAGSVKIEAADRAGIVARECAGLWHRPGPAVAKRPRAIGQVP